MKINKINGMQSFGKTPILTCKIKDTSTRKSNEATLYQMNPFDSKDISDVSYSKNTHCIKNDFMKAYINRINYKDFYVMQNNKTGEVISCAQTEHRYGTGNSNAGLYTLIEEIGGNSNYINGVEPLLAGIVKKAQDRFDRSVYTAFGTDEIPDLKRLKFSKSNSGDYFIPEQRYNALLMQAENHSQIEYAE